MTTLIAFAQSTEGLLVSIGALLSGASALLSSVPQLINVMRKPQSLPRARRRRRLMVITGAMVVLVLASVAAVGIHAARLDVYRRTPASAGRAVATFTFFGAVIGLVVLRRVLIRRRDEQRQTSVSDAIAVVSSTVGATLGASVMISAAYLRLIGQQTLSLATSSLIGGSAIVVVAVKVLNNYVDSKSKVDSVHLLR